MRFYSVLAPVFLGVLLVIFLTLSTTPYYRADPLFGQADQNQARIEQIESQLAQISAQNQLAQAGGVSLPAETVAVQLATLEERTNQLNARYAAELADLRSEIRGIDDSVRWNLAILWAATLALVGAIIGLLANNGQGEKK